MSLPNPPRDFYDTVTTVIVALAVAMAVELRLIQPGRKLDEQVLTRIRTERRRFLSALIGGPLLAIVAMLLGLVACLSALYQGGSRLWGVLAMTGATATIVVFLGLSVSIFFRLISEVIELPAKRRGMLAILFGTVGIVAGIAILVVPYLTQK